MSGIIFDYSSREYKVIHFDGKEKSFPSKDLAVDFYKSVSGQNHVGGFSAPFAGDLFVTTSKSYGIYNKRRNRKNFFEKMKKKKKGKRKGGEVETTQVEGLDGATSLDETRLPIEFNVALDAVFAEVVEEEEEDKVGSEDGEQQQEEEGKDEEEDIVNTNDDMSFGSLFSASSDDDVNEDNVDLIPKMKKRKMKNGK